MNDLQPHAVYEERKPLKPWVIKESFQKMSNIEVQEGRFTGPDARGMRGSMIGILNDAADGDHGRHKVLLYLFGTETTKGLNDNQWYVLWRWMQPAPDPETNKWRATHPFYQEIAYILRGGKNLRKPVAQNKPAIETIQPRIKDVQPSDSQIPMFSTDEIKSKLGY